MYSSTSPSDDSNLKTYRSDHEQKISVSDLHPRLIMALGKVRWLNWPFWKVAAGDEVIFSLQNQCIFLVILLVGFFLSVWYNSFSKYSASYNNLVGM